MPVPKRPRPGNSLTDRAVRRLSSIPPDRLTRIYFIRCSDFIKIGTAVSVRERMSNLSACNPLPLTLLGHIPGSRAAEKSIHALLSAYRHKGEWFNASPGLVRMVNELLTRHGGHYVEPERKGARFQRGFVNTLQFPPPDPLLVQKT